MSKLKNCLAACFALAMVLFYANNTSAQTPRAIKLIVPVPPGASTDFVARLTAEYISRANGVTMVVENRPGASGMIGTESVARSAPDGNTLLMTANTYLLDAQTRKANYHPVNDFAPICFLVYSPSVFVVHSASPYRTLKDLLDAARGKPGELSMAAVGPGSTFQLGLGIISRTANVNMIYVPFPGSAPAVNAALGQHVTSVFSGYSVVSEHIKAGTLRPLAVATAKRIEPLPDVPTFDESGFKALEVDNWFGVIAPDKTPKDMITQLSGWFTAAIQAPDSKSRLAAQGLYPALSCGDQFSAYIRKRYADYGEAIRVTGFKSQ